MTEVDTTVASFSKLLDWFVELFETKIRTHVVEDVIRKGERLFDGNDVISEGFIVKNDSWIT